MTLIEIWLRFLRSYPNTSPSHRSQSFTIRDPTWNLSISFFKSTWRRPPMQTQYRWEETEKTYKTSRIRELTFSRSKSNPWSTTSCSCSLISKRNFWTGTCFKTRPEWTQDSYGLRETNISPYIKDWCSPWKIYPQRHRSLLAGKRMG